VRHAVAVGRIFWIVVAALIGAGLGAIAFVPAAYSIVDGERDCGYCGSYVIVMARITFREPYNAARASMIAAVVVGSVFALATWGLLRLMDRRRGRRAAQDVVAVRGRLD
jgi:hypothetical protein